VKKVQLAPDLSFSTEELATQVVAALGMRGSGKSNLMGVAAEALLDAKIPCIFIDSVGIWFSLRLAANGKTASRFEIPVLGGVHGDIDLQPTGGAVVARTLARSQGSAVLDISRFSKGDRARFCADFFETFMQEKMDHRGPVCLFCEEAQRVAPQKLINPTPFITRMLGAVEEIAETGRNYGIGLFLASLRPQKINKDVLNLANIVAAFQANGVAERKAVADWVQEYGASGRADVHGELPGLPRGTALVWAPSMKIYGRFRFAKKTTYDAGATPTGEIARVHVKPIDLGVLAAEMAATIEEAKTNDPKALKARIAELERQVRERPAVAPQIVHTVPKMLAERISSTADALNEALAHIDTLAERTRGAYNLLAATNRDVQKLKQFPAGGWADVLAAGVVKSLTKPATPPPVPPRRANRTEQTGDLSRCARALLVAIVQLGDKATDARISALSGYKITSSTFANGLSELRSAGLIGQGREPRAATTEGVRAAGDVPPVPTGKALLAFWQPKLSACAYTMLAVLFEDETVTREYLSERTGYRSTSSTFANGISELRTLELINGPHGGDLTIADAFK